MVQIRLFCNERPLTLALNWHPKHHLPYPCALPWQPNGFRDLYQRFLSLLSRGCIIDLLSFSFFVAYVIKASTCPLEEHGFCLLVWSYKKTYKHNNGYGNENCHGHSSNYEITIKFIILWYLKRTLDRNEDITCLNTLSIHKMLTLEWNGWTVHFIIYTYKQE